MLTQEEAAVLLGASGQYTEEEVVEMLAILFPEDYCEEEEPEAAAAPTDPGGPDTKP